MDISSCLFHFQSPYQVINFVHIFNFVSYDLLLNPAYTKLIIKILFSLPVIDVGKISKLWSCPKDKIFYSWSYLYSSSFTFGEVYWKDSGEHFLIKKGRLTQEVLPTFSTTYSYVYTHSHKHFILMKGGSLRTKMLRSTVQKMRRKSEFLMASFSHWIKQLWGCLTLQSLVYEIVIFFCIELGFLIFFPGKIILYHSVVFNHNSGEMI